MKSKVLFVIVTFVSVAFILFLTGCNKTFDSESQEKESTVESTLSDNATTSIQIDSNNPDTTAEITYILNRHTRKFHHPGCYTVELMNEKNKVYYTGSRDDILKRGYVPCKKCNP